MIFPNTRCPPKPWSVLLFAPLFISAWAQERVLSNVSSSTATAAAKLKEVVDQVERVESELLLNSLQHAKLAGVNSTEFAALETTLRERASAELKVVVQSAKKVEWTDDGFGQWGADYILAAFVRASRAGVPEVERATAWTSLQGDISSLLAPATATANASNLSARSFHQLAEAMYLGDKYGLMDGASAEGMLVAREVYERQLERAFQQKDVNLTMLAVRNAGKVQAKYSQELRRWAEAAEGAENAAAAPDEVSLPELIDVISYALEVDLPETPALKTVKANAERQSLQELREKSHNGTNVDDIDTIQTLVAQAHVAGASPTQSLLVAVAAKVMTQAGAELKQALALNRDASGVAKIKHALARAERAGVAGCDASWAGLVAETEAALVGATKIADTSWNLQTIAALADAVHLGQELNLPHGEDSDNMTIARATFERQMEHNFQQQNVNVTLPAVRMAGKAGARYSQELRRWAEAGENIAGAASAPDEHALSELRQMLNYAHEVSFPDTQALKVVTAFVQDGTAQELREGWSSQGNGTVDLDAMLPLLENARSANVSSSEIASVEKPMQAQVTAELKEALALPRESGNVDRIKGAFQRAMRVGLPEADRNAALGKLHDDIESAILKASAAAKGNWSARTIQQLADALQLGHQFSLPHGEADNVTVAKEVFEEQMESSFQKHDVTLTLLAVRLAGKANAKYSQELRRYAEATENVIDAAAEPPALTHLLDIIHYAEENKLPSSKELEALHSLAKRLAKEELLSVKNEFHPGELAGPLRLALENAVRAGVPEAQLAAARAALARSEL